MNIPTLDKCPGYNLYIGGFIALRRPQALKNCNITHIVSVLDWKFEDDSALTRGYQHLHIPVDDVEDENLLEWFPRSNAFVDNALYGNPSHPLANTASVAIHQIAPPGVLIHCAMGKSRSATILLAYVLWASRQPDRLRHADTSGIGDEHIRSLLEKPLSVIEALEVLRRGRAIAEPNEGFMEQLHMYEKMGCPSTEAGLRSHKIYRRWMNKRSVEESLRVNQAPEMDSIRFEDESDSDTPENDKDQVDSQRGPASAALAQTRIAKKDEHMIPIGSGISAPDGTLASSISPSNPVLASRPQAPTTTIKCRKCRHVLATTPFIQQHQPPPHRDPNQPPMDEISSLDQSSESTKQCAHIFLHPLSWMRGVLSEGAMEGRLSCPNPKCGANVGKFAWTGLRCSCGGWVTPGFGLIRGKVDEVVTQRGGQPNAHGPGGGLRLPPGMARKGNL